MELKLLCPCGTKFAFEVEPVNGQMPCPVACPGCGADATPLANQTLAQVAPPPAPAVAAPVRITLRSHVPETTAPATPPEAASVPPPPPAPGGRSAAIEAAKRASTVPVVKDGETLRDWLRQAAIGGLVIAGVTWWLYRKFRRAQRMKDAFDSRDKSRGE